MAVLKTFFNERLIAARLRPPRSLDLNECAFFLWVYLKDWVYSLEQLTLDNLKHNSTREIRQISREMLKRVSKNCVKQAQVCIFVHRVSVRTFIIISLSIYLLFLMLLIFYKFFSMDMRSQWCFNWITLYLFAYLYSHLRFIFLFIHSHTNTHTRIFTKTQHPNLKSYTRPRSLELIVKLIATNAGRTLCANYHKNGAKIRNTNNV